MPELPEVETMVRGCREHFVGATLVDFADCQCLRRPISLTPSLTEIQQQVIGQKVTAVERRAKRIVVVLENELAFVIEPRMTGLMLIADPPSAEHLRLEWKLRKGRSQSSVWFWDRRGLGTVRLMTPQQREQLLGSRFLGPDALKMTPLLWQSALKNTDRAIKVVLLDQKVVAGIGNLYASEILHQAGIHPQTPASALTKSRIAKLHQCTIDILSEAIRYEGSTLGDGTYRNSLNQDGGYQNMHRVYGKQDADCPTCKKGIIERIVQAQRSTFFCSRCQKLSK